MLDEKLRFNFPANNIDPFDSKSENKYFAYSDGYSNLTNELSELSIIEFEKHIPIGYRSIIICQRIKLIEQGIVIKSFSHESYNKKELLLMTDIKIKHYVPSWKRNLESTSVFKTDTDDVSMRSMLWDNMEDCISHAINISIEYDCRALISHKLDVINWH